LPPAPTSHAAKRAAAAARNNSKVCPICSSVFSDNDAFVEHMGKHSFASETQRHYYALQQQYLRQGEFPKIFLKSCYIQIDISFSWQLWFMVHKGYCMLAIYRC